MNEDIVKGNWKQLSGKIKAKWGKLTDNDLEKAEGNGVSARQAAGTLRSGQGQG
jgi:uncharacterized protein YjbJ (UPF0337 family)